METFTEWMHIKSSHAPVRDWIYIAEGSEVEMKTFVESGVQELFRDVEVKESTEKDGKIRVAFTGDPLVTVFELDELGISQDQG